MPQYQPATGRTTNDLSPNGVESVRPVPSGRTDDNDVGAPIPFTQWADRTGTDDRNMGRRDLRARRLWTGSTISPWPIRRRTAINRRPPMLSKAVTEITRFIAAQGDRRNNAIHPRS